MPTIDRSAIVNFSAEKMFDLINDVESYPQFMSGCKATELIGRGDGWIEATLTLAKGGIEQKLTTRNELTPPSRMIMRMVDGPFKKFEGDWQFDALAEDACKVSLSLSFDFKNPLLALTVGKWLQDIASRQVDSLCQRAEQVYGNS